MVFWVGWCDILGELVVLWSRSELVGIIEVGW